MGLWMTLMHIDSSKHPHPRRYRRALVLCLLGVVAGVLMTGIGLFVLQYELSGIMLWVGTLVLVGPSVIFLSSVGFATYLETLETARYGGVYEEESSIRGGGPPTAHP